MQTLKTSLRIAKFLGKVILSLLFVLVSAVAIIHIPPVQRQITRAVSNYLSAKIDAKVYIKRIEFSILGHIILEDLTVWNRDGLQLFSIGKIEVNSSIFDLITGDFIIDEVRIVGLDGQLVQGKDGLNIQFILDAFQPTETLGTTQSNSVKLQFKNVQLEKIDFEFLSTQNGIHITNVIGMLTIQEVEFSTHPLAIKVDKVSLQHSAINILSTEHPENIDNTSTTKNDSIDAGIGIIVKVMSVDVGDTDFSFHQDKVLNTPKFDPSHIDLRDININLSDMLVGVRKDTVAAILHSLSAQLPGFKVDDASATLQWSHNQLVASGLHIISNTNELDAEFKGEYDLQFAKDIDHAKVEIDASGRINPQDLSYFFSDSVMNYFSQWQSTDLMLEGYYNNGKGEIKTLNLKTGNSQLQASGILGDVSNSEKIHWSDLNVNASIGSDFKKTLTPFLNTINLPSDASVQLKSSGNPKKAIIDGKVFTNLGDVKIKGLASKQKDNIGINMNVAGEQVDIGKWTNVSSIGPVNFSLDANGLIGYNTNIEVNGLINDIEMLDQPLHDIDFQSRVKKSSAIVQLSIHDPRYQSVVHSEISFGGPLQFTNSVHMNDFKLGRLLNRDSTLAVSGNLKSNISLDQSSVHAFIESDSIFIHNQSIKYLLDTLGFQALLSPTESHFDYYSDDMKGTLTSNFDIRNSPEVIHDRFIQILKGLKNTVHPNGNRTLKLILELENASLLQLLGVDIDEFSTLKVTGELDEQKQTSVLHATSGKFKGYGISLDTLNTNLMIFQDSVSAAMNVKNLVYNSVELNDLDFDILTKGDTAVSNLQLSNDTVTTFALHTRILPTDSGTFIYPDKLLAFNHDYFIDPKNPVYINTKNIVVNHFKMSHENMQINLDGDLNKFDASLQNVDLTPLNFLLSADTTIINKGYLNGKISYSPATQQLNLKAHVDSLSLYNSNPLTLEATAVSNAGHVPFEFLLTNTSNKINLKGQYTLDNSKVDATLLVDINNPELFTFLVSGVVDEMSGTIKGKTKISGRIQKPVLKGHLQFQDMRVTTVNPKFTFHVQDDSITLDNSALLFDHFTLYDPEHHPLTVDGNINANDYQSISYDLQLHADDYTLMNKPDSASGQLKGVLVIDSDIKLKGNEKDTNVEAKITIKDNTRLIFVSSTGDTELLKAEGIVEFIDPTLALDSALQQSANFYDSLIASLPDFNLNSTVKIEDDAKLRIVIDEQSGDYMETSGGAALELSYDRTGNLHLVGDYTIKQGIYRLSFYDLVKRNFTLAPNSSIHWSGTPENGDLNIKAVHTVQSNSIGLIGHEIGENEKSIYKRSLNYEVGINISGTIDKPIVSFSLDLPQEEKTNYPVLANKLDRLRQPEFQSELNKQVFGLLVLGGFLPETSGSDINSSQIATTALSNSVNSLLASQLNRFASQYIKGVNIDVGIQSYSDYSAPGGKTQTAMDFRVSKRVMDDRLSFEIGGDFDINSDQSGANTGTKNYRGDVAIIYDLTGNGDKQLKLFNNETYDIVYQEIRNTGVSLIFIREFSREEKKKRRKK